MQGVGNRTATYALRPANGSKAPPYGGPRSTKGEHSMVHMLQLLPSSLASNAAYHFAIVHMKSLCGKVHNIDTASACEMLQYFPCGSGIYSDEEKLTRTMEHYPLCKELLKAYRQKLRMPSKTPLSILYEYAARHKLSDEHLALQSSCGQEHLYITLRAFPCLQSPLAPFMLG